MEKYKSELINIFTNLIEATLPELEKLNFDINTHPSLHYYHFVLLFYYQNKVTHLENLTRNLKKDKELFQNADEYEIVKRLAILRLAIRKNRISIISINALIDLKDYVSSNIWKLWSGEIYGIIAFALGEISNLELSNKYYQLSIDAFNLISANKKKIRALHNYIATLSCIDTNQCLIKEFLTIFKQAYKSKAYDFAGLSLGNIAREYQAVGMLQIADRYSKKAIKFTSTNPHTIQCYLTKLYRAHILIDLKREEEAKIIISHCSQSVYSEIRGGALVLESILLKSNPSSLKITKKYRLLPGWIELLKKALKKSKHNVQPTEMEEKLIYYISTKERTKDQIIKYLYGDQIDEKHTNNRFYVLISRIKSKWPKLIIKTSDSYYTVA